MTEYLPITTDFQLRDDAHGDPWSCIADMNSYLEETPYHVSQEIHTDDDIMRILVESESE